MFFLKIQNKGFTLIELLVVIAIIGILSSIVLSALNTARSKGNDSAVKGNLNTVRTQSVVYFDKNAAYSDNTAGTTGIGTSGTPSSGNCGLTGTVFKDANVNSALTTADKATGGSGATNIRCVIVSGSSGSYGGLSNTVFATTWNVYIPLTVAGTTGWCVDSTGVSKADTAPGTVSAGSAASVAACP